MTDVPEARPDPGGTQTAINRYRELAKYIISVFAAIGALLVAGTQLASIGDLSWDETPDRVIAVVAGLALSVCAVAYVIALALSVLRPIEMSLDDVVKDPKLIAAANGRPSQLGGAESVADLREILRAPVLSEADRATWIEVADRVVDRSAFEKMRLTFDGIWRPLLGAAVAGVVGICAFTWGANPPASATTGPTVQPRPVAIVVSLTPDGREALTDALGRGCVRHAVKALSIGGVAGRPLIVTLPGPVCKPAQFVLDPVWGSATAVAEAPIS